MVIKLLSFLLVLQKTSNQNIISNKYRFLIGQFWGVSELLMFNDNSAIFQLYHGKNKLIFNEMMLCSALY
jgi:hypothetical protein